VAGVGGRVRAAAGWVAASMLLTQAVALGRSIITARLLSPDDFGLYSMAATAVMALSALTSVSLDQAITSRDLDAEEGRLRTQLDATWTAELVRKLIVTLLLAAAVYPAARFYGRAELLFLLPVAALVPLIQGLQNIGLIILRNQITFARLFWNELTAVVASAIVAVTLALILRNVWALVCGQLVGALAGVAASYFLHPYRPKIVFDRDVFRQSLRFGKYATVIGVAAYVTTTADNVLLGKLFGSSVLGVYAVAYSLASLPAGVIMGAVGKATFPAYAELALQGQKRVGPAFNRSLAVGSALLTLVTVPMFLLAPEVISVLYGRKWAAAAGVLRVLSLVGLTRGIVVIISYLHLGLRKPKQLAAGKVIEAVVFLALLYPFILSYGVMGAAYAAGITYLVALFNRLLSVRQLIPFAFGRAVMIILASIASGGCGAVAGWLTLKVAHGDLPRLIAGGTVSMAFGSVLLYWLTPGLRTEVREIMAALRS
jgi:lipopolysaccharide exporter